MDRFEAIMRHTLKWEGGYVNDPDDAGGETKYGITKRAYPNVDIKNLTIEEAIAIYRKDYYPSYIDSIKDFHISGRLYDLGVNMGPKTAAKLLQLSCNDLGKNIIADGIIGPNSLEAINSCNSDDLYEKFYNRAKSRYESIAKKGNNAKYLKGWMNRLNDPIVALAEDTKPSIVQPPPKQVAYLADTLCDEWRAELYLKEQNIRMSVYGRTEQEVTQNAKVVLDLLNQ